MLIDHRALLTGVDGTNIAHGASGTYPSFGVFGVVHDLAPDSRDVDVRGKDLYIWGHVTTALSGGAGTQFHLFASPTRSGTTGWNKGEIIASSAYMTVASLAKGALFAFPFGFNALSPHKIRYLRMGNSNDGAVSAGAIKAGINIGFPHWLAEDRVTGKAGPAGRKGTIDAAGNYSAA